MSNQKYRLDRMWDGWVSIYRLVGNTHYEWVKDVCDMDTANKYVLNN